MTAALDPYVRTLMSGSYQYWFNRETVTLKSEGANATTSYTVPNAKRFKIDTQDVPVQHQAIFLKDGLTWIIPAATLPSGCIPKPMDKISPSTGEEYTIQTQDKNQYGSWYRCITLNLRLALGFRDTLSFKRPVFTNVGGHKSVSSYTPIASSLPGKVIETGRQYESSRNGKRQNVKAYEIHIQSLVEWNPDDHIEDQDGKKYTLVGSGVPGTIDNYLIYTAEAVN